jgi:hypothetical protein
MGGHADTDEVVGFEHIEGLLFCDGHGDRLGSLPF